MNNIKRNNFLLAAIALSASLVLSGCAEKNDDGSVTQSEQAICASKGATLANLGPHSMCIFEENRQCTPGAISAGRCSEYGFKLTGYENDKQSFCAASGYDVNTQLLQCELPGGKSCSFDAFWNQSCP